MSDGDEGEPVSAGVDAERSPAWTASVAAAGRARALVPGVLALVVLAVAARVASGFVPHVSALILAVVFGIVVANTVELPSVLAAGARTHTLWLEAGIVLMGARVSLSTLLSTGPRLAVLVVGVVVTTLVLVEALSAFVFDVEAKLGSLLAAGASVCGVSAAVAVAGTIGADDDHLAYAAGTVLLFDVLTLFAYPAVGSALALGDRVFGVWAGLTMFSTGPVTAAGFAFSDVAGRWATVTKLTRNLLLGGLVAVYSVRYANPDADAFSLRALWATFPKFVLGFFAVVVLTSSGFVSDAAVAGIEAAYRFLFLLAFAGLGLSVDVDELRTTGHTPIALVLTTLLAMSALALVAVSTLLGA